MKKFSILFSVLAFAIGLVGAISYAASPARIIYGYVNTAPNPDICVAATVQCVGNNVTCIQPVPEAGNVSHDIREWKANSTTCGDLQKMNL